MPRLEDKLEAVRATFFLRRQEDSGQKLPEPEVLKQRCFSYEKHLTRQGIQIHEYDAIYELAVEIYNEKGAPGPFGVDYVVQAARRYKSNKKEEAVPFKKQLKARNECEECLGTSLEHTKTEDGKLDSIVYEIIDGKKKAKRCVYCYGQ